MITGYIKVRPTNFNREMQLTHHFVQELPEGKISLCGISVESLSINGSVEDWLGKLKDGEKVTFSDPYEKICGRCQKSLLSSKFTKRTGQRAKKLDSARERDADKKALRVLVEIFNDRIAAQFLAECFNCGSAQTESKPIFNSNRSFNCKNCRTDSRINLETKTDGSFTGTVYIHRENFWSSATEPSYVIEGNILNKVFESHRYSQINI